MRIVCLVIFAVIFSMPVSCYPATAKKQTANVDKATPKYISDAPFGLKWGMSSEDLKANGVKIEYKDSKNTTTRYLATNLPKTMNNTDVLSLYIDSKHGLVKITWFSTDITDDAYGNKGKIKYTELKELLTNKYGSSKKEYEYIGRSLYKESDEFYQCLNYSGCGMFATVFEDEKSAIVLKIDGTSRGVGYIEIVYEHKLWQDVLTNIKNADAEAL